MLDPRKFSIAGVSIAAFFSIVGSSTTLGGCVPDEVSGGPPASYDALGGMGGMPPYAGGGAMNGVGGDPVPEAAGNDGGTSHLATNVAEATKDGGTSHLATNVPDAAKEGGTSHFATNATRGAESPRPAGSAASTGDRSPSSEKLDSLQQGSGTEAGGAECVTSNGAPYIAQSC